MQLLFKPEMVSKYTAFDSLLRQLAKLTARRRLFGDELYRAAHLLGKLTEECYEEGDDGARSSTSGVCTRGYACGCHFHLLARVHTPTHGY